MQAQRAIQNILNETYAAQGWAIPSYIVSFQSTVLADKIDKNPWQPEPSYAERYLTIKTLNEALELANTCWFTRAVFPELGSNRGINSSYYVDMGTACYEMVAKRTEQLVAQQMAKNFEFLAEAAYTAIRHYGEFRSMWD